MTAVKVRNIPALSDEAARARAAVRGTGLGLPDRPDYERPRLTDTELTEISDTALTDLLVQYTAWKNYAGYQLAIAEIDESCLQEQVATANAVAMVRDWGGTSKDRVSITKAQREADPAVIKHKEQLAAAYAYRKLSQVVVNAIEADLFAVSREITRRNGGDPKTRRSERFSA